MSNVAGGARFEAPSLLQSKAIQNPGVIWPLLLSALGWLVLALFSGRSGGLELCLGVGSGTFERVRASFDLGLFLANPVRLAAEWAAMVAAMMLPVIVPHLSILCARTHPAFKRQVLVAALAGYLGIWLLLGVPLVPILLLTHAVGEVISWPILLPVLAYGAAAIWLFVPIRCAALRRCHRVPIFYGGSTAQQRGAFTYGMRLGGVCAVICLPAMAAPMLSGQGLMAMFLVTQVLLSERLTPSPRAAVFVVPMGLIALLGVLHI
jgi:predicted metal-binding integral membrane protein DUF2182